jgi:pyruvate kinase
MNRIMRATEPLLAGEGSGFRVRGSGEERQKSEVRDQQQSGVHPITAAAVAGGTTIAKELGAKFVVVATRGGGTCRLRSKQRDCIPTIGVSDSPAVLRRLALFWGVMPLASAPVHDGPALRAFIDQWGRDQGLLQKGDRVVFVTGTNFYPMAQNIVVIHEVE